MSTPWYAAFGLLTVLALLNAVFLVAAMRQIGVLHQRVQPVGHGQVGGPRAGRHLPALSLETIPGMDAPNLEASILGLAFVSPSCGVCDELLPVLHAFDRTERETGIRIVLATTAGADEASAYAAAHEVKLPFVRNEAFEAAYDIPGTPYVLALRAVDGKFEVLAGGVVNTMEQLEDLVQTARDNVDAFAQQRTGLPLVEVEGPDQAASSMQARAST